MGEDQDAAINSDPDENRLFARHMIGLYRHSVETAQTTIVEIGKWLMTSLLAINGAAAIATWQIAMDPGTKVVACALFVVGILAALLSGYFQVMGSGEMMKPMGLHIGYWVTVEHDGIRSSECEDTTDIETAARRARLGPVIAGWAAIAFFVAGIVVAGSGGLKEQRTKSATPAPQTRPIERERASPPKLPSHAPTKSTEPN